MNAVVAALVRNDLRRFFADRRAVIITILVPVVIASFFATILGGDNGTTPKNTIHMMVVDNDHSFVSEEIIANLRKEATLSVQTGTETEARALVNKGKVPVAMILPKEMGKESARAMFAGADAKLPQVALLYDPSHGPEFQMVRGLAMQQVMQVASKHAFSAGSNVDEQLKALQGNSTMPTADKTALTDLLQSVKRYYGQPGGSEERSGPGGGGGMRMPVTMTDEALAGHRAASNANIAHAFAGMAVQGVLFFAIDAAMGILKDRRTGIWKRLRAAPISRGALLGGKVLSTSLITMTILGIIFGVGGLAFKIRIDGSVPGFLLLMVCNALMVATFGLLVAALGRTEAQSRGYAIPAVLGMSLLGGAWFPAFLMPKWVQGISLLIPSRWAVDGYDAMLWRGFGFSAVLPSCFALLGFAVVFGTFAVLRFRWDNEQ